MRGVADDGTSTTATAIVMPKNNLRAIAIAIGISTVSIVVVGEIQEEGGTTISLWQQTARDRRWKSLWIVENGESSVG